MENNNRRSFLKKTVIVSLSLWIGTYLIGRPIPWFLENLTPAGTSAFFVSLYISYVIHRMKTAPGTTGKINV